MSDLATRVFVNTGMIGDLKTFLERGIKADIASPTLCFARATFVLVPVAKLPRCLYFNTT